MVSMTSSEITLTVQGFSFTHTGKRHRQQGQPSQDRVYFGRIRGASVLVVCDGMGSRPLAGKGAEAAVRAAKQAVRQWVSIHHPPVGHLVRLIELLWRLQVLPLKAEDCATTCCVVVLQDDMHVTVASLGDATVVYHDTQERFVLTRPPEDYANHTHALGVAHHMDCWHTRSFQAAGPFSLMVMTDGIADDIKPGSHFDLLEDLSPWCQVSPQKRWHQLKGLLASSGGSDDQSLIYLEGRMA